MQATQSTQSTNTKARTRAPRTPRAKLNEALHNIGFETPTWKRVLAANVLAIGCSAGAGYVIASIASYTAAGILVLTGSTFLVFMTFMLAILVSVYTGLKISQHVGNYVLSGQIDRDIVVAKNKVIGLFERARSFVSV